MSWDIILLNSPFVIVLMSIFLLYGIIRINSHYHKWEFQALYLTPIVFAIEYFWIGVCNPDIQFARLVNRGAVIFALTIGISVAYYHLKSFKKGKNK